MILVSSDEFILPELGKRLGAYAQPKLTARGVEINACTRVTAVGEGMVELSNGQKILATTLIWAAGNAPNPLVATLPIPKNSGRILVDEYLAAKEFPGVSALGACASIPDRKNGAFHPRTAQHAIREARCAARNVAADIVGGSKGPIRFSTLGRLAAIGPRTGVANVFGLNFSRFFAWLWRTIIWSSFHGSRRRCALLSIGRSISVLQGFRMCDCQTSSHHEGIGRLR
jgi:NADH:ubiquinone reductase (H+-translocating)